jgi:hypothetical protein
MLVTFGGCSSEGHLCRMISRVADHPIFAAIYDRALGRASATA